MDTKSNLIYNPIRFSIIGAGKVGKTIADKLQSLSMLDFVLCKSTNCQNNLIDFGIQREHTTLDLVELFNSDCIILALPDDSYSGVVDQFVNYELNHFKLKYVFHTSGLISAKILYPLVEKGVQVFAAHPVQTFYNPNRKILNGITWNVENINTDEAIIQNILGILGGKLQYLPEQLINNRSLYHLMCVVSSNFVTTTLEFAKLIAKELNVQDNSFLSELIQTTTNNSITNLNFPDAPLTGPLARKDFNAIKNYLETISANYELKSILINYLKANIDLMVTKKIYNLNEKQILEEIIQKYQ